MLVKSAGSGENKYNNSENKYKPGRKKRLEVDFKMQTVWLVFVARSATRVDTRPGANANCSARRCQQSPVGRPEGQGMIIRSKRCSDARNDAGLKCSSEIDSWATVQGQSDEGSRYFWPGPSKRRRWGNLVGLDGGWMQKPCRNTWSMIS